MNPEIKEKVKLWRPTDDKGMLLKKKFNSEAGH